MPNGISFAAGQNVVVYGILFVGVLLLVESVAQIVFGRRYGPAARINRRLRMLNEGIDPREVLRRLHPRRDDRPVDMLGHPLRWLDWMLASAGIASSPLRLLAAMFGCALVVGAILWLARVVPLPLIVPIAAAVGAVFPLLYLERLRQKRVRRFGEQLPEAIDLIVRSLRAGHPLNAGLRMVSEEMPDPIGTEFGIVVDEITYGLELEEAIANLTRRVGLPDLQFLAMAVRIHHTTGGNLAEVLDNLSKLVRSRLQMFRKVRAITAEGRLSAWFLSLFPVVMGGFLVSVKSDYYAPLAEDPLFPWIVGLTIALLIANVVVMRWMVNIKV